MDMFSNISIIRVEKKRAKTMKKPVLMRSWLRKFQISINA